VVRVWDAAAGQPLTPAAAYPGRVWKVGFDPPGGRLLVTTGREVQVLDAATARPLTPKMRAPRPLLDARFTDNGDGVLAVLAGGAVVRWDCAPAAGEAAQLARLAEFRAGRLLDRTGAVVFLGTAKAVEVGSAARAALPAYYPPPDPAAVARWRDGQREALVRDLAGRATEAAGRGDFAAADVEWSRVVELSDRPRFRLERGILRTTGLAKGADDPDRFFAHWDAGLTDVLHAALAGPLSRADQVRLNNVVWAVVRRADAGAERYAAALRLAELCRDAWGPNPAYLNTLGVARYRADKLAGAVTALSAADARQPGDPSNLAFLAMASYRLGNATEAAKFLDATRRAAKNPRYAGDPEVADFLREAEAIIPHKPAGPEAAPLPKAKDP
jgi:hypothetical protein